MHLRFDPMERKRDQPHAALGIKAPHGLHEPDIAFLDQVALRQPIAQVVAAHGHD